MSRARRATRAGMLVATLSMTLVGTAMAKRVMMPSPRPPSTQTAPQGREVTTARAIDPERLPEITIPSYLKQTDIKGAAGADPVGLRISAQSPKRATGSVTLTVDSTAPSAITIGERTLTGNVFASESASLYCDPHQTFRASARWETYEIKSDGSAVWTVTDGFTDPAKCEVKQVRRQEIKLARIDGLSVPVHAARVTGGFVVFTPRTDLATGDTTIGAIGVVRSPVSRVFVPTQKGESAAVLLSVEIGRLDAWLKSAGVAELSEKPLRLTLRVDVSQTVSEPAPTLFVRSSMTLPEKAPGATASAK